MGAAVVMEGLETRRLLAGSQTAFQPDLEGQLAFQNTVIGLPGEKVKYTLAVINEGARLYPATIGIGFFINGEESLSTASFFADRLAPMSMGTGHHRILHGTLTLPTDSTMPVGKVFIFAVIDINVENNYVVPEAPGTNGVAFNGLINPTGGYSGTYTSARTNEVGSLNLAVSSSNGKLVTNVTTDGGEFANLIADDVKTTLTARIVNHAGVRSLEDLFSLSSTGTDPADGITHYVLTMSGSYDQSSSEVSGTYNISGTRHNRPFSDQGQFTVTAD